ncbi:MAG: matrixin family metalloprotease [Hymenobacter sp.]|nr:matrixin family metalloprotease [Hymenobacter sp.]
MVTSAATPAQAAPDPTLLPVPLCSSRHPHLPPLPDTLNAARAHAIIAQANVWANGTVLHYYFFNDKKRDLSQVEQDDHQFSPVTWVGNIAQQDVVREAFAIWKNVGIGLEFVEVKHREDAEIRIGFMLADGAWSYTGTEIVSKERRDPATRTMNFGWDLRGADGLATALHEIGHTLGLPHEHMNPFADIEFDTNAVYTLYSQSPYNWSQETIDLNILKRLERNQVKSTRWDPDSVMEYAFPPGLIRRPANYWRDGLNPPGKLSEDDKRWAQQNYPSLLAKAPQLVVNQSMPLDLVNGGQANFIITPPETRYYDIRTFGKSDILLALFEYENKEHRYRTADDDSGLEKNALLYLKLFRGHRYMLRVRVKYRESGIPPSVMMFEP